MICYRDTTFCNAPCGNDKCPVKLTPAVQEAADRWWGSGDAPIAVGDRSEGCQDYRAVGAPEDEPVSNPDKSTPTYQSAPNW